MVSSLLLRTARIAGSENVAQIKQFAKALQKMHTAPNGVAKLHLETTPEMADEFVRVAEEAVKGLESPSLEGKLKALVVQNPLEPVKEILAQAKQFFPEAYAKGNKGISDIIVKKFGQKSGIAKVDSVLKNAEGEIISKGKVALAANQSGVKVKAAADGPGMLMNYDITGPITGIPTNAAERIIPNIQYSVDNGVAHLSVPRVKGRGYEIAGEVKAPQGLFDAQVKNATGGEVENFGDALNAVRNII